LSVTGNLVSLTNGSTLNILNGALVSVSGGSIFQLTGGSLGVFGAGTNSLNITNTAPLVQQVQPDQKHPELRLPGASGERRHGGERAGQPGRYAICWAQWEQQGERDWGIRGRAFRQRRHEQSDAPSVVVAS